MKKVSIVLENCEYYDFNPENVTVILDGLGKHCYGIGKDLDTVEHCLIKIENNAKCTNELEDWQESWQKRIDRDITQVQIDDITYYVNWNKDSDYENEYEKDYSDTFTHTYIISKTRKTENDF